MTPTAKKRGSTVLGVKIGCHAFRRCCLKAVSKPHDQYPASMSYHRRPRTWGPPALQLLILFSTLACAACRVHLFHSLRHTRGVCGAVGCADAACRNIDVVVLLARRLPSDGYTRASGSTAHTSRVRTLYQSKCSDLAFYITAYLVEVSPRLYTNREWLET